MPNLITHTNHTHNSTWHHPTHIVKPIGVQNTTYNWRDKGAKHEVTKKNRPGSSIYTRNLLYKIITFSTHTHTFPPPFPHTTHSPHSPWLCVCNDALKNVIYLFFCCGVEQEENVHAVTSFYWNLKNTASTSQTVKIPQTSVYTPNTLWDKETR